MPHLYHTRFQAKQLQATHKKTPDRTVCHKVFRKVYLTRFQTKCIIDAIRKLQDQCHANPHGIANLQAIINLYKYLQTCTDFIKSHERLCRVIEMKTDEILDDISVEIEKILRGECGYAREDKLFELQNTIEEFLVKMDQ